MKQVVVGGVTLFFPGSDTSAVPDGFGGRGWQPVAKTTEAYGRGGACRIAWGASIAFWRPFRHGGLLGPILGDGYVSTRSLRREIEDTERLLAAGVDVSRVLVGRAERRQGRWRLGLVMELLEGATLVDVLSRDEGRRRRECLLETGRSVARLHDAGFRHPDLHPGNLFVVDGAEGVRVYVLDLTGGSWGGARGDDGARRNLVRCARWWHKHRGHLPALRDVVAFLRGYEPERRLRRALFERGRQELARALAMRRRRAGD